MKKIMNSALLSSLGTGAYVVLVALFIFFVGKRFAGTEETILIPVSMLMLLVFSVAFIGVMIFGKPVMLYIDGKKKEALYLLGHTLGILFVIVVVMFVVLALVS